MSTPAFGLNPAQLEAVNYVKGPCLVLAGAGSGKTRVITQKIARLIEVGLEPKRIAAITFTNKAATEMRERARKLIGKGAQEVMICTFHALGVRIMRQDGHVLGLKPQFSILDSDDVVSILKDCGGTTDANTARQWQWTISAWKNSGLNGAQAEAIAKNENERVAARIMGRYEERLAAYQSVDFDDLIGLPLKLLADYPEVRERWQAAMGHVLVDEYQDTNATQYEVLKHLVGERARFTAVGDDDQSIYGFRGARVGNMRDFEKDFQIQHIVKLEENYRSHSNILDAANAIISHNTNRLGKNLWTSAGAGEPVRLYDAYNDNDEAQFIVDEIKMLHCEGTSLGEIALLYRSNAQSRILEHALFSANLPYRVYGGLRFFERAEIKHALAYMRLIANANDDTALLRVINFPARGIGARSLEQLQETARAENCSIWQAAINKVGNGKLGAKGIEGFVALIRQMVDQAYGISLAEMTELATSLSGLMAHYENDKEGEDRIENLKELVTAAVSFTNQDFGNHNNVDGETEQDLLTQFLSHASLEAGEHQADVGKEALQLMTVHASKGLEFKVVFISGLEEGLCPHEQSMYETQGLEEERRLMYVAVTRARQRLYLSHAQSRMLHGKVRYGIASRFLDEIPEALLKRLNSKPVAKSGRDYNAMPAIMSAQQSVSQKNAMPWKIGQQVAHAKFGNGVVVSYEGNANDMRVQVNFGHQGLKWLAMEFAKLTPI